MNHKMVKIIIFLLLPVLIMGQLQIGGLDDITGYGGEARFGLGGLQTLTTFLTSLCNQFCPNTAGSRFFVSTNIICALKCPPSSSSTTTTKSPLQVSTTVANTPENSPTATTRPALTTTPTNANPTTTNSVTASSSSGTTARPTSASPP